MKVERISVRTRKELLLRIDGFLRTNGWSTHKIDDEKLLAKDTKGGGLAFNFIPWAEQTSYNAKRSTIHATTDINSDVTISEQPNPSMVACFSFVNGSLEFDSGYMIGNGSFFCLCLDGLSEAFPLFFCSGYIDKTHEFNGGRVSYSSFVEATTYPGDTYSLTGLWHAHIPFSAENYQNVIMGLGGSWHNLRLRQNQHLKNSKFLTNLCHPMEDIRNPNYNELSALSATSLLHIGKSRLSGLHTCITPNFFYKTNQNTWVHAGAFNEIRVLKEVENFTNGQVLNLGSEKFMIFRPSRFTTDSHRYTMAVKIA